MTLRQIEARAKILFAHAAGNRDRLPQLLSDGAAWLAAGAPRVGAAVQAARKAKCEACEMWQPTEPGSPLRHCAVCKCLAAKLAMATARCPLGKWPPTG